MTLKNMHIDAVMMAFESSYDGIHILDSEGNTLYINEACTRIEGVSKEEAFGKNIRELVDAGVYSESVTLKVLETKKPTTIIQTAKNGNEILATGAPTFNEDGSIDNVIVNSRDITDLNNLKRELSARETELERLRLEQSHFENVIAKSTAMKKVLGIALTVSKVDSTVLLTGESGVGKGLLAQFIHDNSSRAKGHFIKIDCSSIPETLIESELFGYEAGAFTGAEKSGKIGLLEMANGGTVFLDEIGEMPLSMQPKLMRAIQDREIVPVGGKEPRKLDVRFVSATNVDLVKMVEEKTFREDLYYRLNVVPIHIPALREREDDILPLIKHMLDKINTRYDLNKELAAEVYNALLGYSWPGNVRQLENIIERMLVSTASDVVYINEIPADMFKGKDKDKFSFDIEGKSYGTLLAEYDKFIIKEMISREGSIPKAAKKMNVDPTTLRRKLEKYKEIEA